MDSPQSDTRRWFAEEVEPHDLRLRAYLRGSFPSVRDVDDVVQESYLRLWKARTFGPVQSAKAFLFTISRRIALNVVRKNRNAPFVENGSAMALEALDEHPNASEALVARERIDLLANALMDLPPRCREVVILHKLKGYSQREVARRLGLSERTVETHVRVGVAKCHAYLTARGCKPFSDHEA